MAELIAYVTGIETGVTGMAKRATAIKTKYGYKAVIVREDGSTLRATKCHVSRDLAIASAQLWIEQIEENSRQFNTPRKPVNIGSK